MRLLQERHHTEDLEVKVLALEKDCQLMEVENQSLVEKLSRSTDQEKGTTLNFALLRLSIQNICPCCVALEMKLRLSREAVG